MKTAELEGKILDYYVALAVGHVWRRKWYPEDENYNSWQSYEEGWGNPTPPYSSDWAACGPLIDRFGFCIESGGKDGSFMAHYFHGPRADWDKIEGRNAKEATCRAVVALHFGQDVPDVKL